MKHILAELQINELGIVEMFKVFLTFLVVMYAFN